MPVQTEPIVAHTPGPWRIVETQRARHEVFIGHGGEEQEAAHEGIARVLRSPNDHSGEIRLANARLIAAAPELLKAARVVWGRYEQAAETRRAFDPDLEQLGSAIAKAEGRKP